MAINQGFLGELDHELVSARKILERIPEDKFGWKPHDKSMTFQQLAQHMAEVPGLIPMVLCKDEVDFAPDGKYTPPPPVAGRQALLELFDKNIAAAKQALAAANDDAAMMKPWTLLFGGKTVFTLPRVAALRGFSMNHFIHHRGQLSVYLRLNDIPVPSIYGPSADEGKM